MTTTPTAVTAVEALTINDELFVKTTDDPDAATPEARLPVIASWLTVCRLLDTIPTPEGYLAFVAAVDGGAYQPDPAADQKPAWLYLLDISDAADPESGGDMWTVNLTVTSPDGESTALWADHESGGTLNAHIANNAEKTAYTFDADCDGIERRYWLDRAHLWANQG